MTIDWRTITPSELERLKVIRTFGRHHHASSVCLLEGDIVKKMYNDTPVNREHFDREIKFLTYLKDYKYVSRLVHYDPKTLTIFVTYCGVTPPNTAEYLKKIRKRADHLYKTTGFIRREPDGSMVRNVFRPNTGLLNGKIYFFDFGGEKWRIEPIPIKKDKKAKKSNKKTATTVKKSDSPKISKPKDLKKRKKTKKDKAKKDTNKQKSSSAKSKKKHSHIIVTRTGAKATTGKH